MTRRRWHRPLHLAALVFGSILLAAACGSDDSGDAEPPSGPAEGAELYQSNCASCHGADLRGTELGPSHLSIVYEPGHHPDESFRSAIRDGTSAHHWDFGPMPRVAGLNDDEVDALIAYVRENQERDGFEPYPPEE